MLLPARGSNTKCRHPIRPVAHRFEEIAACAVDLSERDERAAKVMAATLAQPKRSEIIVQLLRRFLRRALGEVACRNDEIDGGRRSTVSSLEAGRLPLAEDVGRLGITGRSASGRSRSSATYTFDNRYPNGRPTGKVPDPTLGDPSVSYTYHTNGPRETMTDAKRSDHLHLRPPGPAVHEGDTGRDVDVRLRCERQRGEHRLLQHERDVSRVRMGPQVAAAVGSMALALIILRRLGIEPEAGAPA